MRGETGQAVVRWIAPAAIVPAMLVALAGQQPARASGELPGGIRQIVFAARPPVNYHYYENFGHYVSSVRQWYAPEEKACEPPLPLYREGGRLVRLDLVTGEANTLLDDPQGGVRDPQVHYEGRKILFSYRPGGQAHYHLYEIGADGTGLVQLTDGPYDDIEPAYLPSGRIVFCSSRCRRYVGCNPSPVAALYGCDAEGNDIRPLSAGPFTENTPWVLPDGRVAFTRWEYVDRNQMSFHHLWAMNPDGTGVAALFGNRYTRDEPPPPRFFDVAMLDAKPLSGSGRLVSSFSPSHGRPEHLGYVTIVDPASGPDRMASARTIGGNRMYRDPYPLDAEHFLVADGRGIWLLDDGGEATRLYKLAPGERPMECHEPRPLTPRPREPVVPPRTDPELAGGVFYLQNVYRGRNMAGLAPGEVKRLLVLEQLPKPVQFSGGQEPLTIGGSFTLHRVLGTVPVEEDGSAHFEVPAGRALFFAALDERDRAVKQMHSFVSVMPGERIGCVGCHEARTTAAASGPPPWAAVRGPRPIEPIGGVPDVLDYPRDVQPILDRLCVACHGADRRDGGIDLCGDRTPMYSQSYWTLVARGLVRDGRNYVGNTPPRTAGSAASPLLDFLEETHYGVRATARDRTVIRLWIDSGATYPGTYAGLGTGVALVRFPDEVIERRCGACHGETPKPYPGMPKGARHYRFGPAGPAQALIDSLARPTLVIRLAYYGYGEDRPPQALSNLSRPEKSQILRAPLARKAGGLGLCGGEVFASAGDPDYRALLAAIREASEELARIKRFDMQGFRPSPYYVRLMRQYGVLPDDLAPDAAVEPYATDRAYWRSLWLEPAGGSR